MVGHWDADVAQLGVGGVDIDATIARLFHDTLVHSSLTNAGLSDKMGSDFVANTKDELLGFFESHFCAQVNFHLVFPFLVERQRTKLKNK
jgi:hypothetical protein